MSLIVKFNKTVSATYLVDIFECITSPFFQNKSYSSSFNRFIGRTFSFSFSFPVVRAPLGSWRKGERGAHAEGRGGGCAAGA